MEGKLCTINSNIDSDDHNIVRSSVNNWVCKIVEEMDDNVMVKIPCKKGEDSVSSLFASFDIHTYQISKSDISMVEEEYSNVEVKNNE